MSEVPQLTVVTEAEEESAPIHNPSKRDSACHINLEERKKSPEERKQEAIEFFASHGVASIVGSLLSSLLLNRPERPISHSLEFLRTSESLSPKSTPQTVYVADPNEALEKVYQSAEGASAEYLAQKSLRNLFTELLGAIETEKPDDVHSFCLTWLRWHRHRYEGDE